MQKNNVIERDDVVVMSSARPNDLMREVYGVMGSPVDATDVEALVQQIDTCAANSTPFLLSTINLNFLVASRSDAEFRDSLLLSDHCTADGMPVVWIARLLGVPIKNRVAGSDLFDALKSAHGSTGQLKVFLFGGADGVAAEAARKLNAENSGVISVGSFYPGYGSVAEMSADAIIDTINSSSADFLAVALGARKGQAWLLRNHDRLQIPIRAHLGAALNFQAGTLKRAPAFMRRFGLEWLWRIKEEPSLWRRYFHDGIALLLMVVTQLIPLVILTWWQRVKSGNQEQDLSVKRTDDLKSVTLSINGHATAQNIGKAIDFFQDAVVAGKDVVINFNRTRSIDARFLGLLLMLDKQLKKRRLHLRFTGIPRQVAKIFSLSGFKFLLRA